MSRRKPLEECDRTETGDTWILTKYRLIALAVIESIQLLFTNMAGGSALAASPCDTLNDLPHGYVQGTLKQHRSFALTYLVPALQTGQLGILTAEPTYSDMRKAADDIDERMIRIIAAVTKTPEQEMAPECDLLELSRRLRDVWRLVEDLPNKANSPGLLRDFNLRSMRYLTNIDSCEEAFRAPKTEAELESKN